ncbi:MAG: hypothetical protein KDE27_26045 [Planctomycetes bacterium]|nr:hypothetical protein [Planctomycetota bacterium]
MRRAADAAAGALLALALAAPVCGQDEAQGPPPDAEALLQRYQRLGRDQRNTVVRNLERRLRLVNDDVLQRVAGFERGIASYPRPASEVFYQPKDYAPVAAPRHLIAAGTPEHRRATAAMTRFTFLTDLHACVGFDWRLGKAVRLAEGIDDDRRFENYVRGYMPGSDHAIGQILETLDHDIEQRRLANYFEHLYADRNGGVYAGVTMFDAWNAGVVVEMPDTDAIAFAREILQTSSFVAPIPPDRRRTRLYDKVRAAFASHREYRTLRLAAAAAFVAAEPKLDPTYLPLVRRCRWLWLQCNYDVDRFRQRLVEMGDRTTFLAEIDRAIESSLEVVDGERDAIQARADYMRALADRELQTQGS